MTQIANRLAEFGAEVIDVGLVDSPASAEEAGIRFRREQAEVVFLYISSVLTRSRPPLCRRSNERGYR